MQKYRILLSLIISCLIPLFTFAANRPNVIVVMTDDQGYGEFSFHGNPIARTPHFDQLASEGIRLTDFHVAPMCTPTRGQLMTGVDAFRNAASNVSSGRTLLRPDLKTMADVFREAGYRTGIFGKWHLGDNHPFRPEDRGFDEALWFPSSHINAVPDYWDNDYFDDTYLHNGKRRKYKGYCTDIFFEEALEWIGKKADNDKPFFAYIPLNSAHWPWFVPDHYRDPIRKRLRQNPEIRNQVPEDRLESLIGFLAMGANIDDNLGKLEKYLVQSKLKENTIVVFLTDNGSTFGPEYFNAGMQGKKTTLWEGGHRVPCVVRWPGGNLGHPRDMGELTQVQDLLPTLADLAEVKSVPDNLDGQSLAPLFRQQRSNLEDRILVINYSRMPQFKVTYTDGNPAIPQRDGAAVLWRQWRLLENRELYDVRTDPHQDHDVAAQFPGIVRKLSDHLQNWWDEVKDDVMKPQRVIIGSQAENPMLLTACEWLDVFVDQQVQIRRGVLKHGTWHLTAAESGTYEFTLRRWPVESGLKLTDALPRTQVTDGEYVEGTSLPIAGAKFKITGQHGQSAESDPNATSITFVSSVGKGDVQLDATFTDADGKPLLGAYYVTVERL